MAKLGDVATYINGYAFKPSDWSNEGLEIIRIQNLTGNAYEINRYNGEYNSKFEVNDGDVLISWSASLGVYVWNKGKALLNQHIFKVVFDKKVDINKDFFVYQVENLLNCVSNEAHGATMKHLTRPVFEGLPFYLPDLETQNVIAKRLNGLNNLILNHKKQISDYNLLVKSRFIEMFGEPHTNPKGYPLYTVDDVMKFQGGSQPNKKYFEYEPTEDNIRLIQIRDYKTDNYKTYIPKSMAKRFCNKDDIMIGRYGPPIFQILGGLEGSFNVALMKVIPKMGNTVFLRNFLKQECLLKYLEGMSQRTAGQDGIQMDKLKAYPFPYPPEDLQNKFADFVAQVDKSKLAVQQSLNELETLKKSLMQQYFG